MWASLLNAVLDDLYRNRARMPTAIKEGMERSGVRWTEAIVKTQSLLPLRRLRSLLAVPHRPGPAAALPCRLERRSKVATT